MFQAKNLCMAKKKMYHVNCFIIVFIFVANSKFCQCENAKLTVDLANSGFHRLVHSFSQTFFYRFYWRCYFFSFSQNNRDLNYVVVFPEYQGKHHTFLIKQLLPSSVYVSIDQLNDLNRFNKVNIYLDNNLQLFMFTVYCYNKWFFSEIFPDSLFHWEGIHWYWKANRTVRTILHSFVWKYGIFTDHFIANPFSISCAGQ